MCSNTVGNRTHCDAEIDMRHLLVVSMRSQSIKQHSKAFENKTHNKHRGANVQPEIG